MAGAIVKRKDSDAPVVAMLGKGFRGYKHETEQPVRTAEVKENQVLERLKQAWRDLIPGPHLSVNGYYEKARKILKGLNCSAKDIENFSLVLGEFQTGEQSPGKAGMFLSALINTGNEENYIIHTKHLGPIDYLGYHNEKSITVRGDAKKFLGWGMGRGNIVVEGDVGDYLGYHMRGGSITVEGNAGESIGWMRGGAIIVRGDAGAVVGQYMRGGEIHLEGDYESISDQFKCGKIFHKGVLIVDK
jgi:hypothetical protein